MSTGLHVVLVPSRRAETVRGESFHDFPSHAAFFEQTTGRVLDEGTPEELVGAALVLAGEEVDSCRDELLQAQLAVVVRVDRLESGSGHLRIESDDVEKQLELVFLDHAVGVGVDGAEEERQRTGERGAKRRILHLLLERRDESFLVE